MEIKLKSAFHLSKMVHTFILSFFRLNNENDMKDEKKNVERKKPNRNNDSPFKSTASGIPLEWFAFKTFKLNFSPALNTFYREILSFRLSFCHNLNGSHK